MFMGKDFLESDTEITSHRVNGRETKRLIIDEPHQFSMRRSGMKSEITPSIPNVIAFRIRTVESQQDQGIFHHLLCLERHR